MVFIEDCLSFRLAEHILGFASVRYSRVLSFGLKFGVMVNGRTRICGALGGNDQEIALEAQVLVQAGRERDEKLPEQKNACALTI
ncbi:hypothetical protein [Rhizobium sullae]|uniref:hypothetical protein n=1 Tax=Rhizobium sullae TaxID=50338 RepID=UPI001A9EF3EB|nr:hypothetical protein [Rhizobium sullae]